MALKNLFNIKIFLILISSIYLESEAGLRILGGRNALKNEFPFVVRIDKQYTKTYKGDTRATYQQICTGAALTSTWIITAAHCKDENLFVRYNSHFPKELGYLSLITKIVIYPGYFYFYGSSILMIKYDIALFYAEYIIVSEYAKISAIDYTILIGHEAVVLGFGGTNASEDEVPLQVLKGMLTRCSDIEGRTHGFLCVVPSCGLEATICGGDSGGPVVHASGIIGVNSISWGDCNEYDHKIYPGHAADGVSVISPFIDWISNVIADKIDGIS